MQRRKGRVKKCFAYDVQNWNELEGLNYQIALRSKTRISYCAQDGYPGLLLVKEKKFCAVQMLQNSPIPSKKNNYFKL